MDKIEFRGKREDNGEWVVGDLEHNRKKDVARIHTYDENGDYERQYIVDNITVGQFTGQTDKNGKKVFGGDVVRDEFGTTGIVILISGAYAVDFGEGFDLQYLHEGICEVCEVAGNIYDNPELVNQGNDGCTE